MGRNTRSNKPTLASLVGSYKTFQEKKEAPIWTHKRSGLFVEEGNFAMVVQGEFGPCIMLCEPYIEDDGTQQFDEDKICFIGISTAKANNKAKSSKFELVEGESSEGKKSLVAFYA
jgi:hypothetical protein